MKLAAHEAPGQLDVLRGGGGCGTEACSGMMVKRRHISWTSHLLSQQAVWLASGPDDSQS